jgi:hypothetical protein
MPLCLCALRVTAMADPANPRPILEVISWVNSDEGWLSAAAAPGTQENDGAKCCVVFRTLFTN